MPSCPSSEGGAVGDLDGVRCDPLHQPGQPGPTPDQGVAGLAHGHGRHPIDAPLVLLGDRRARTRNDERDLVPLGPVGPTPLAERGADAT